MIKPEDIAVSKLTGEEIINILCNLAVRTQHLEDAMVKFFETYQETTDFILQEAWKGRIDLLKYSKKTPMRELNELKEQFKDFIAYYHSKEKELTDRAKRYSTKY